MTFPFSTDNALRACLKLKKLVSTGRDYIFLAAMPKSASTFLHRALVELTGFQSAYLASHYRNIEQELYLPSLIDNYDIATVTQQHTRANHINLNLMKQFRIRPVVLVRNVPDVIVSIRDHLLAERMDNLPGLYVPDNFRELSKQVQLDFVTSHAGPWLISFYASWVRAQDVTKIGILWLHYEQITGDWTVTLRRVLDFFSIEKSDLEIERALREILQRKKSQLRINKAVSDRGKRELSDEQRQRLLELSMAYSAIDFSAIGITKE